MKLSDRLKDNSRSVYWPFVSNYEQFKLVGNGIEIHQINRLARQDLESVTRFTYLCTSLFDFKYRWKIDPPSLEQHATASNRAGRTRWKFTQAIGTAGDPFATYRSRRSKDVGNSRQTVTIRGKPGRSPEIPLLHSLIQPRGGLKKAVCKRGLART